MNDFSLWFRCDGILGAGHPRCDGILGAGHPHGLLELALDWFAIVLWLYELGDWLQRNSAAVSVLFAAAVALFTWQLASLTRQLWLVTKQSADAATRSAAAAVRIELPILRVATPDLHRRTSEPDKPGGGLGIADLMPVTADGAAAYVPSLEFKNAGRTPALPVEIAAGHCVAPLLTGDPRYTEFREVSAAKIIAEQGEAHLDLDYEMTFTSQELEALAAKKARLWFFCRLTYTDFMNEEHEFRWCWAWDSPNGSGHYYFSSWKKVPPSFRARS